MIEEFWVFVIVDFFVIDQRIHNLINRSIKFSSCHHLQHFHRFLSSTYTYSNNLIFQCRQIKSHSRIKIKPLEFSFICLLLNGHTWNFYNIVYKFLYNNLHNWIHFCEQRFCLFISKKRISLLRLFNYLIPRKNLNRIYYLRVGQLLSRAHRTVHLGNHRPNSSLSIHYSLCILFLDLRLCLFDGFLLLEINYGSSRNHFTGLGS